MPEIPKIPNILFIISDDHAAHAMNCYGSRINRTPNVYRDPTYAQVVQQLKAELHRLQKAVGDVAYKKEID